MNITIRLTETIKGLVFVTREDFTVKVSDTSYSEQLSSCTFYSTFSSFHTFPMNKTRKFGLPDWLHFAAIVLPKISLFRFSLNKYKAKFNSIFTRIRKESFELPDMCLREPLQCP